MCFTNLNSMSGLWGVFKWWWDDREKWWGKKIDEKYDDKKLDKGDCPTFRIIYI